MKLFLSPHNDDAVLFGAITLMREHPLVVTVTDSYIQGLRGEPITADQRWEEDVEAVTKLGCQIIRLGIRDDVVDKWLLVNAFKKFGNFDAVYAPAIQGGNSQHDLVAEAALEVFGDKVVQYTTYTPSELYTEGTYQLIPNQEEIALKNEALACYKSQINYAPTAPHFEAVKGKPEWFI